MVMRCVGGARAGIEVGRGRGTGTRVCTEEIDGVKSTASA